MDWGALLSAGGPLALLAGLVGATVAWKRMRALLASEREQGEATARRIEQEASKLHAERDEIEDRVAEKLRDQINKLHEQVLEARAAQADAVTALANAQAEYTKFQREAMSASIAKDEEIASLRYEVQRLRQEVNALRAQLGLHGAERRADNRMSVLEYRADVAQERAERAHDNAEQQEHRNDDTPGHA